MKVQKTFIFISEPQPNLDTITYLPLTRKTEEHKDIRTEDMTFVLAAYRGNIRT